MDSDRRDDARIAPIAEARSPFGGKFGIPRQAGLVDAAVGRVVMLPPYDDPAMFDGLQDFSHVWLTFGFHACITQGWRKRVRPPRLGGNHAIGVWASRSPFRPNFLGLSAVRLLDIATAPELTLRVGGLDLLDGTPVYDIKPYLPYADAIPDAQGGFAPQPPPTGAVSLSEQARQALDDTADSADLRRLIFQVLALDPRPAYRRGAEPDRIYGMSLADHEIRWRVGEQGAEVVEITPDASRRKG